MIWDDRWDVVTPHQAAVARAYLGEQDRRRRHLVIYLSGAHAYGFPSPDSDLDLKCVHLAPTGDLVGLAPVDDPGDGVEIIDGVEVDYGSNELGPVLRGCIKGNGNYLERLLGELALGGDRELLAEARPIVTALLSRRVARHYGGFAASQLRAFDERPSAKRALYVLRTAATGRHLLATGELVTDLRRLPAYAPPGVDQLMTIKQRGEREPLTPADAAAWRDRLVAAIAAVDVAATDSVLPDEPTATAITAADHWLRRVRRAYFDRAAT
ncbi:MAG: nucleotidyltransferase domain-containing protein [Kofleriaceae bacterium]